jgi:sugar lactone lactonase YvrE
MKNIGAVLMIALVSAVVHHHVSAQKLEVKWKTDTLLKVPESVLFDADKNVLYVACIDGKPDGKDGRGNIAKVSPTGKIEKVFWVAGLNAPKGMGLFQNTLYVADITRVVVIDITAGKIINKIEIEGAKFLNDITVDTKGNVYISDSGTGKIHTLNHGKPEVYFESTEFKGINGLLAINDGLYIVDFGNGANYKLSADKKLTKVTETSQGADGIVLIGKDEYLVSSWHGEVYYVNPQGQSQKLIDTKDQKLNAADIAYDEKTKTLFVPTFLANTVMAYSLSK